MPDVFLLKAIAKSLLLPPTGLLLVALIGLAIIRRHPRAGRTLATVAVATLLALSMPIVAGGLVRLLDDSPPIDLAVAKTAQAIVIPGGGVRRNALEYGGDTLGRLTLERVRYGARLAKQTGLPVLVTGGSVLGNTVPEAVLMKEALENEYGVTVRWVEDRSRNTRENAEFTARMLAADGVRRVVLVLHAFDVPRAVPLYERTGLQRAARADRDCQQRYRPARRLHPGDRGAGDQLLRMLRACRHSVWHAATDLTSAGSGLDLTHRIEILIDRTFTSECRLARSAIVATVDARPDPGRGASAGRCGDRGKFARQCCSTHTRSCCCSCRSRWQGTSCLLARVGAWAAAWLAAASLFFYAWWDYRYVALLLASILANYFAGRELAHRARSRPGKWLLAAASVGANLALLGYYKYADFFIGTANAILGWQGDLLHVVLPLGISFFTFTQIAFLVDAYRGLAKEYRFVHYVLFVTYFPHLVAGPVLHHKEMMPQFDMPRNYQPHASDFSVGITMFTLGLAKKLLIADNLAEYAARRIRH